MKTGPKRVFIVDDHPLIREGLSQAISGQPDMTVCGTAVGAPDALSAIEHTRMDVVIVDLSLAVGSGLDLIKSIRAIRPNLPVLVLSMHDEALYAERALRAGASGYVMKRKPIGVLLDALRRVLSGQLAVSEETANRLLQTAVGATPTTGRCTFDALANRELEVYTLLGQGRSTREIAKQLGLSMKTVSTHRENIKQKLGFKNASELVRQATHWVAQQGAE
jgi:DNA-binding NarL/FixJ family response regulator